mmetsp:Transcript_22876/g.50212  ORF Transcript_22876/g.50212 Transcript_22876/m.50212 type:complete len:206 (+) Transcript_22876:766-1383(+)
MPSRSRRRAALTLRWGSMWGYTWLHILKAASAKFVCRSPFLCDLAGGLNWGSAGVSVSEGRVAGPCRPAVRRAASCLSLESPTCCASYSRFRAANDATSSVRRALSGSKATSSHSTWTARSTSKGCEANNSTAIREYSWLARRSSLPPLEADIDWRHSADAFLNCKNASSPFSTVVSNFLNSLFRSRCSSLVSPSTSRTRRGNRT